MHVCPECGASYPNPGYCPQHGRALADTNDDPLLGVAIGPYRIARLLGAGGMGRVYVGVHPTIGSRVAIKVLARDGAADRHLVKRFFDEARAVNLIRHENIVNILDLDTLPDGRPYIVMEHLDGAPLAAVIAERGPLPLGGLTRAMTEVLDALAAAHDAGVVHRDLKPDNIFISPSGRAKVLDFGIAKLRPELGAASDPTRTGSLLGTPHYMSPEQTLGKPVDARADLYAAGLILFEGATGRRPFAADSLFDLMRKHLEEAPPPPRSLRPDLPAAMEDVILCALQKQPDRRFASARAMATALAEAARDLPADAWEPIGIEVRGAAASLPSPPPTPRGTTGRKVASDEAMAATVAAPAETRPEVRRARRAWTWAAALALASAAGAGLYAALRQPRDARPAALAGRAVADAAPARAGDEPADAGPTTAAAATSGPAGGAPPADAGTVRVVRRPPRHSPAKPARKPAANGSPDAEPARKPAANDRTAGRPPATLPAGESHADHLPPQVAQYLPKREGIDPTDFDPNAYLRVATRKARKHWPDAELVRIDVGGVYPTGRADLTLGSSTIALYRFISPAERARAGDAPLGADRRSKCVFYVFVDASGVRAYPVEWNCDDLVPVPPPRCSIRQVWKKAIAGGAPGDNAVAQMGYWATRGQRPRWYFSVPGHYNAWIDDDC
ncbi:MAG: serine/threonine protein kinase [Deltaproteobacteria bacterium]|nr:MAG: serine/threonine protein kinase [Deltaproteobacteria bacterium]